MKVYNWYRKYRSTVNGVLITILSSMVLDAITNNQENVFKDFGDILKRTFASNTLSCVLFWGSAIALAIINLMYMAERSKLEKQIFNDEFIHLMKANTSKDLVDSVGNGCLSWGEGKTIVVCNEIMNGWNPENVLIDSYNDREYKFIRKAEKKKKYAADDSYFDEEDYNTFRESKNFSKYCEGRE